ncbi:hypothetical protein EfmAA96_30420 (plasmid) [Enterococcus faecium]|nr:hypothetical protein EfmAA96_30420 [Enterococcus faecium]
MLVFQMRYQMRYVDKTSTVLKQTGHLTTKLAKISKQVTSIELDSHLFNLSSEKLKLNTRVTLIHQDILQFQFPNKQRYKIVGNIPYE